MSKTRITLDEKIVYCEETVELWAKFFDFFGDNFEDRKITADAEAEFFRAMTELARREYRFSYFMAEDFDGGQHILEILSEAVSLSNIYEMSEAQASKYHHAWHVVFIAMNKCLGRLMLRRPQKNSSKNGASSEE